MLVYNDYRKTKWNLKKEPLSQLSKQAPDTRFINEDIKRPLKHNHSDLSFKGPFLSKEIAKIDKTKLFENYAKFFGDTKVLENRLENVSDRTKGLISVNGNEITIKEKTVPQLIIDGALYPIVTLPGDILYGAVKILGKIPGLKKVSNNILETKMFKNIKSRSTFDNEVNSLSGAILKSTEDCSKELINAQLRKAAIKKKLGPGRPDKPDLIKEAYIKEHNVKETGENYVKIRDAAYEDYYQKHKAKLEAEFKDNEIDNILTPTEREQIINEVKRKDILVKASKSFDPRTGNYDLKHERALNRIVSGMIPAIFLANDAYNLSRMMDDDPNAASKERKTRLRQETTRILSSAYLTLITMGAFQNFINKSKFGIALNVGLTVLVTEMFSRLTNGKHVTRLTPAEARAINAKEAKEKSKNNGTKTEKTNDTAEVQTTKSKTLTIPKLENKETNLIKNAQNKSDNNSNNQTFAASSSMQKQVQKPLLSFDTLLKASGVVLALGYGLKGVKHLPFVKKAAMDYFKNPDVMKKFKLVEGDITENNAVKNFEEKVIWAPFTSRYKKWTTDSNYQVDKSDMDGILKSVEDSGFKEIAATMRETADKHAIGDKINLGTKDKPIKPLVNFAIAPFKFMWENVITLPYRISEKIVSVFKPSKKSPKDLDKMAQGALMQSYDRIKKFEGKLKNCSPEEKKAKLEEFIRANITKSFNTTTMSGVSNAELSNLAKSAAWLATIWFLMTDNYNMVMLKSNGKDVQGADTKFKERFVQEGSRLFYQTLLIDLFNSTFRNQYNSALFGMCWITAVDTFIGEILTRKSVGTPVLPHSRDELIEMENKQNNSTGFKKKYYNFMQRLTGKRAIKTYEVEKRN